MNNFCDCSIVLGSIWFSFIATDTTNVVLHFVNMENVQEFINNFIPSENELFLHNGIRKLPRKWSKEDQRKQQQLFADDYFL